jgi:shikimate kinase
MERSLVLVGPRCCGKTSVGQVVAEILGIPFVDADERFVKKHRMSVLEYINAHGGKPHGWPPFRKEETIILEEICVEYNGIRIVFTPGGGAVAHNHGEIYRVKNVKIVREIGYVAYILPSSDLEESARILTERELNDQQSAGQRPPLTEENDDYKEMVKIVKQRHPLYLEAATSGKPFYTGEKTVPEIAQDLAELVR